MAKEKDIKESVDLRHLIDGIRKDIEENYGETCGICPGETEEVVAEVDVCTSNDETIPVGQETEQSAARNAEVVKNEIALKKEVGQNDAQAQANDKHTKIINKEKEEVVEEPKEEMVVEEPKGEVATENPKEEAMAVESKSKRVQCTVCDKWFTANNSKENVCPNCKKNESKINESKCPACGDVIKGGGYTDKNGTKFCKVCAEKRGVNTDESKVDELNMADTGLVKGEFEKMKNTVEQHVKKNPFKWTAKDRADSKKRGGSKWVADESKVEEETGPSSVKILNDMQRKDFKSFKDIKKERGMGEKTVTEERDPWLPHMAGTCMACGKPATIKDEKGGEYCSPMCKNAPTPQSKMRPISYPTSMGMVGRPSALESKVNEKDSIIGSDGKEKYRVHYTNKNGEKDSTILYGTSDEDIRGKVKEAAPDMKTINKVEKMEEKNELVINRFGVSELSDFRSIFEGIRKIREESVLGMGGTEQQQRRRQMDKDKPFVDDLNVNEDVSTAKAGEMINAGKEKELRKMLKDKGYEDTKVESLIKFAKNRVKAKDKTSKNETKIDEKKFKCPSCGWYGTPGTDDEEYYICPECGKRLGDANESKVNEVETMPGIGSATVPVNVGAVEPGKTEGEEQGDPAQNPESFDKAGKTPEADEHGDKEYFGKAGDDNYYYLMVVSDEDDGSPGGLASEEKPNVEPEVKSVEQAPVGKEI